MSRGTKIVAITTVALALAVVALALLNRDGAAERKAMQDRGAFLVKQGELLLTVTMDDIEDAGVRAVDANYKTNLMPPELKKYTGVALGSLLDFLGVDCSEAKSVSFSAADGYVTTASISDALDEDNCLIVFEEAGKPLGTRESGGVGPYMVIFANDRFSQRWCKYLLEIAVN